jgi:uncharacterized protein (DUF1501 family)
MACDCKEHSRATLLRQAAAQAGSGLPPIDPRMPVPAGTGLDRRSFMLRSGAAMLSVYGASQVGFSALEAGIARAQSGGPAPVLVSVFLDGGADSLSILAPTGHSRYPQLRPNLALSQAETLAFAEDSSLRWHPRAANLRTLHEEGKVTVMPAIGYTDADQSHFTSRHYWEVGALNPNGNTGWLGRFIDVIGADDNPLQGLSLDGWLSPALATASKPVASVDGPEYDLWMPGLWEDEISNLMYTAARDIGDAHAASSDTGRKVAGRVAGQAMRVRERLDALDIGDPPASYPDEYFGRNLAALAAMLDAGLPIRCVALSAAGGYDTHDNQEGSLGNDLGVTFDSIFAFQRDLEQRGIADQVVTLVWSEFGRRPEENGTGDAAGTDHGAAGTAFLVGSRASGGMVGEFPGLTTLDEDDNLRHTVDFRGVYCGLLEQWFDQDVNDTLIPGQSSFTRPTLIQ